MDIRTMRQNWTGHSQIKNNGKMDIENGRSYNETKMDILRLKLVVKWTLGH